MIHPLIENQHRNLERLKTAGAFFPEGLAKLIQDITERFIELHGAELAPDTHVMTAPVWEAPDGQIVEAMSRKLAIKYFLSDINKTEVDDVVAAMYAEFKAELANHPGKTFYPYILLSSAGIVIDPSTFEPVVSFITRFGLK